MIEILGAILAAVVVAVVSGVILDWWSGWRGKKWISAKSSVLLRRIGIKRTSNRVVLFVSAGGTCRDPMAKVIAEKLIEERAPQLKGIVVEGRGLMDSTSKDEVSHAARIAIKGLLGEDLLEHYKPASISAGDIRRADIILVMAADLLHKDTLPPDKTYLLKEFFGSEGDVADPWPDGRDKDTLDRYRKCAEELKAVMESGLGRLIKALGG